MPELQYQNAALLPGKKAWSGTKASARSWIPMTAGGHPRHALAGAKEPIPVRTTGDARHVQDGCCKRPGTGNNKGWILTRGHVNALFYPRRIFSMDLPFASSSTSLSMYRIFRISGSSISSMRTPQTVPVILPALGCSNGA